MIKASNTPLSALERRLCAELDVDPDTLLGRDAKPLIVGEGPGDCPMFPWPPTSAGYRLFRMSCLSAHDYLRSFARTNLWPGGEARKAARTLLADHTGAPLVLLGTRVADAFGADEAPFAWGTLEDELTPYVRIPHPSGRSMQRDAVRVALWRALLWAPVRKPRLDEQGCQICHRRPSAHPEHPVSRTERVLCRGEMHRIVRPM